jgi:hypothetical protein
MDYTILDGSEWMINVQMLHLMRSLCYSERILVALSIYFPVVV